MDSALTPNRLTPDVQFPAYSYVPGKFPHPISDPQGHSYEVAPVKLPPFEPQQWPTCRAYLYGIDLFNNGYYWEAHEIWEGLWHACGRTGTIAHFIKGLIKLAASGVKAREGKHLGVRSHAERAEQLFRQVIADLGPDNVLFLGLCVKDLRQWSEAVMAKPPVSTSTTPPPAEIIFDFALVPVFPNN